MVQNEKMDREEQICCAGGIMTHFFLFRLFSRSWTQISLSVDQHEETQHEENGILCKDKADTLQGFTEPDIKLATKWSNLLWTWGSRSWGWWRFQCMARTWRKDDSWLSTNSIAHWFICNVWKLPFCSSADFVFLAQRGVSLDKSMIILAWLGQDHFWPCIVHWALGNSS